MKKGAKITLAVIGIMGTAGVIYWLYMRQIKSLLTNIKSRKDPGATKEDIPTTGRYTGLVPSYGGPKGLFPLKRGSRGKEVEDVQKFINSVIPLYPQLNLKKLTVDGVWGSKTDEALKKLGFPTVISESLYLEYKQKTEGIYSTAVGKKKRMVKSAAGNPPKVVGFGTFKKEAGGYKGKNMNRMLANRKLAEQLMDQIHSNGYKDQRVFEKFGSLNDEDFIMVDALFNKMNNDNGYERSLQYEIRGISGIGNEEDILYRYDELDMTN